MDIEALRALQFEEQETRYAAKDTILYALALGYGEDPLDERQLRFVVEGDLVAVPTQAVILADPGFWQQRPEYGIDWRQIVHGEQALEIVAPLPATGIVKGRTSIRALIDKGEKGGSILYQEKRLFDDDGLHLATSLSTVFLRGNGGGGGFGNAPLAPTPVPEGPATRVFELKTLPQSALIYRLSGDYNPLHADPAAAGIAGFPRPILHGLCTYGLAARALVSTFCDREPGRLKSLFARFTSAVFPGETLRFEFHGEGPHIRFRARVLERDAIVLDRCSAEILS